MGRLLLVEGTCGSGKSTLCAELVRLAAERDVPATAVSQRYTYGPIAPWEDLGLLDDALNLEVLVRLVDWLRLESARTSGVIVVDSFHCTQRVRPGVLSERSWLRVDDELRDLGARCVLLTASRDDLQERVIEGRAGTPFRRYATKFGASDRELLEYLLREQQELRSLTRRSGLMTLEIAPGNLRSMSVRALEFVLGTAS